MDRKRRPDQVVTGVPTAAEGLAKRVVLPILLLLGVLSVAYLGRAWWDGLSDWIARSGGAGYLVFFLAFVLLTTFCFPVSVLGFSAGAMFGPGLGLGLLLASGLASGVLMFFVGRFLFRGRIARLVATRPRLATLDNLAREKALRLNLLARLSPLNYGVVCYTLAAGKSPFSAYCLGMTAILPSMLGQVWTGALARNARQVAEGKDGPETLQWVLLGAGVVFFSLLSWQVGRLARQAWRQADPVSGERAVRSDPK